MELVLLGNPSLALPSFAPFKLALVASASPQAAGAEAVASLLTPAASPGRQGGHLLTNCYYY